jgi:hypothetical protein
MRHNDAAIPSRWQNSKLLEAKEKRKQKTEEKRR